MAEPEQTPPEGQGRIAGLPFDWRRPTRARLVSRAWNPNDRRLFTPKSFGWGYGVNFYWVAHPVKYAQRNRQR
ncbi:DUF5808 domain-containing protein [Streptacidiphilus sp. N1-3]|uniref:DUF5808 domain-containing protein n=1 Tax=Streptacidiphilus alkalitolerans TaxID=3342712 RepID=A0ABV6XC79_9ACTN